MSPPISPSDSTSPRYRIHRTPSPCTDSRRLSSSLSISPVRSAIHSPSHGPPNGSWERSSISPSLEDSVRTRTSIPSPRHCSCQGRPPSRPFYRPRTSDSDESMLDSVFEDEFLEDRQYRPCWRTLHAVFLLTYAGRKMRKAASNGKFNPLAGHAENFRTEDGYVLKAQTQNEASTLESLSRERSLRPFAPQFMGCVEREGRTFIKMQDVLLSMTEPNFMDVKMGLRTFAESEVGNDKRRMDLLKKALAIQDKNPTVYISEDEKANGISKYRFMSVRDHASSSATLGFRVQGVMKDQKALTSKDFTSHRSAIVCRALFRSFFERASPEQRAGLLQRLTDLHAAIAGSEWFANHEVIGSSLLIGYDVACPTKFGIWMIDFARTERSPTRLTHNRPWTLGSREDGYLLGVRSLIKIWSDEFRGDIPLNAEDWHYRAEGHDCIVIGYHGAEPGLQGKVLRLAKECATRRHRDTLAGHPATAYNDFVSTMLTDFVGPAADPGQVVHVDRSFLAAVAEKVAAQRPEFRAQQSGLDLESEYQLLMEDGSYVAGADHAETVAVELKLKMGHLPPPMSPTHWAKSLISRFAMQQFCKLEQGLTGKVSSYCPLDLFSGDFDRTQSVVHRLLDTPQNNLRVFYGDALLVPQQEGVASSMQSGKAVLDARLRALLGGDGGGAAPPSLYLSELVAKCLLRPTADTAAPLLKKIRDLQRLGLDIETLWPLVKDNVKELQQIYHVDPIDVSAVVQALPPCPPLYCQSLLQRDRRGQRPATLEQLRAASRAAQAERQAEVAAVRARLQAFDPTVETRKFLLSQSLKACSLMVALAHVPQEEVSDFDADDLIRGSDGRWWRYSLRLLDLDAKNLEDVQKWYELDQTILRTFLTHTFGPEVAEQEMAQHCRELERQTTEILRVFSSSQPASPLAVPPAAP
eukprot:EG_transcript_2209